ncbi:MAG: hypothetical protein WC510_01990 [Candidatus Omnitrophota bacterium]
MVNTTLTKPNPLKQAFSALDTVMQEVCLAEEETIRIVCSKLREAQGPGITAIIGILQDWGKVPAAELKERALRL